MFMSLRREEGFTLLETVVVVIVGGILIAASIGLYQKLIKIHRRQQGVILIERELNSIQQSLSEVLMTLPGREIGYFSGSDFSIPQLPDGDGIGADSAAQSIKLGIVTPVKINGFDAVSVLYARRNSPRIELAQTSGSKADIGTARAVTPGVTNSEDLGLKPGDLMLLVGVGSGPISGGKSVSRL